MTEEEAKRICLSGAIDYMSKYYEKAIQTLMQIPEGDGFYNKRAQAIMGIAYLDLHNPTKAIEHLEKMGDSYIPNGNIGNLRIPKAPYYLVVAYILNKNIPKAIEYCKTIPNKESYDYSESLLNIGIALGKLGKPEDHTEAINYFEEAGKYESLYSNAQWNIGVSYIKLDDTENASKAFISSTRDLLEMPRLFNLLKDDVKLSSIEKTLSKILDSPEKKKDFFNTTIKEDSSNKENREKYKKIFIRSLYTISLLHVSSKQEQQVAHYTRKCVAEQMLFAKSKLRLSSTIGVNDPKEGKTLLDFLELEKENENKAKSETPYLAFITCFTLNPESLNQFRLYGKEDNKEATGVSIIVNKRFFNSSADVTLSHAKSDFRNSITSSIAENKEEKPAEEKLSLYRCIYIDPETKKVISIGHKEEYSFYREIKNLKEINRKEARERISEIREYEKYTTRTLRKVKNEVNKINNYIKTHKKDLDESIISDLLLPLSHLTKHAAFKEEQECRIFDIENIKTSKKIFPRNPTSFSEMYLEYNEDLTQHIEKVIFAPMTPELEQFEAFSKYKGYNFPCERCDHPFSTKTT